MSDLSEKWAENRQVFRAIGSAGAAFDHANEQDKRNALVLVADYADNPQATAEELAHEYRQPFHRVMNSRYLAITKGYLTKTGTGFKVTPAGRKAIA